MRYKKTGVVVGVKNLHVRKASTELRVVLSKGDDDHEVVTLGFSPKATAELEKKGFPTDEDSIKKKNYKVTITVSDK